MALPVTVYRWDDPGAPQLDLNNGSMLQLLKKCLIDGYGTKPGAGWTLNEISADNNNMIFSPASQSWYYLLYDDARNSYITNKGAMIGAIDGWVDIETPISTLEYQDWTIRIPENSGSNQFIDKRGTSWCIIATSEWFYLLQHAGYEGGSFVGRLDCAEFDLAYTCIAYNPYWHDPDCIQFLRSGREYFTKRVNVPVLQDPNTSSTGILKDMMPSNFLRKSKGAHTVERTVWIDMTFQNSSNKIVGRLPNVECPLIEYSSAVNEDFSVVDGYLFFGTLRWKIS